MVEPVARVEGLWKSYGGVPVLADVSIDLDPGEVHALVGGNGAGKSTLMKAISGAVAPDAGTITIGGRTTHGMSLRQAHASNVYMVPQEPQLFGHLSVYENVSIALDRRVSRADVAAALAKLSSPINLDSRAHDLSISDQQLVELCRGILREAKVLIVDEPTAALTAKEVGLLFAQLRRMAMDGVGIFYVSHRLSEIFALCDRVTVMRDGRVALQGPTSEFSRADLVAAIAPGTQAAAARSKANAAADAAPALEVASLAGQGFADVSFTLRAGEVLGIAGVVGSGRTELADTLYGLRPGTGSVRLQGKPYEHRSAHNSVAAGMTYVPEDRHADGVFLLASVPENVTSQVLDRVSRWGFIQQGAERKASAAGTAALALQRGRENYAVSALSGGNQQKVSVAKSLASRPRVVILDEPSRGVDVGARADLYSFVGEMAEAGMAVLLISSDFEEIVELADRVLVMRDGTISAELTGDQITFEQVRDHCFATAGDLG